MLMLTGVAVVSAAVLAVSAAVLRAVHVLTFVTDCALAPVGKAIIVIIMTASVTAVRIRNGCNVFDFITLVDSISPAKIVQIE
jgi:hypothetical protein